MPVHVRFLGVSGFEIWCEDGAQKRSRVVIDPFLAGDSELGLPPSPVRTKHLTDSEAILVTHGAHDHLGQAVEIAKGGKATLCCGVDVRIHALREGLPESQIAKMIYGCTYTQGDLRIKALGAQHVSFFRSHGTYLSGQPLSYLLEMGDGYRIFHSGDTSLFGDLKLYGELYRPHVAMLCVGAAEKDLAPLPPEEAALAADWLNAPLVIPMHFRPGSAEPEAFAEFLSRRRPDIEVAQLQAGEQLQLPAQMS